MDTSAVAEALNTTPRRLRQFLRSEGSTFQAVGSGARYDFTASDLPALSTRFHAWAGTKGPRPAPVLTVAPPKPDQIARDRAVWDEEGPIQLEDIRRPDVRARVRQVAAAQERRLDARLMAVGLHITQMRVRAS